MFTRYRAHGSRVSWISEPSPTGMCAADTERKSWISWTASLSTQGAHAGVDGLLQRSKDPSPMFSLARLASLSMLVALAGSVTVTQGCASSTEGEDEATAEGAASGPIAGKA